MFREISSVTKIPELNRYHLPRGRIYQMCTGKEKGTLGTRLAQVEVHRKIDVCAQLHQICASCTELHCGCTVHSLCKRAGTAVATAAVAAAFQI